MRTVVRPAGSRDSTGASGAEVDSVAWTWSASSRRSRSVRASRRLRHRARRDTRGGTLFFCVRGAHGRRARVRAGRRGGRRGARSSSSTASTSPAAARRARRAAAMPRPRRSSSATRRASSTSPRSPARTARRPPRSCCTRSSRPRAAAGLLTNIERRVGGERGRPGSNTPEAIDLQRLFREMLDAGDRACVMEATSIAQAQGRLDGTRFAVLVFTNLTQDHLDFHGTMEAYFEAKRALFAQAERAVVQRRRRVRPRASRRAARRDHVRRRDDVLDGIDLRLRGALQPRERDRRGACRARARRRRRRDPARHRVGRRRARAASSRSTRASRSR